MIIHIVLVSVRIVGIKNLLRVLVKEDHNHFVGIGEIYVVKMEVVKNIYVYKVIDDERI